MSASVLYMSMSLDGFITGPNDGPGNGLGDNGMGLHDWLPDVDLSPAGMQVEGPSGEVFAESMQTGAVLVGRNTFEYSNQWGGEHHDGVHIFVPTRREAPDVPWDNVHYVTDGLASAMAQAKQAANGRNVLVHGAELTQALLREGLLDELQIHLIPVLLGDGRRLFEHLGSEHIELEATHVLDAPGVTHLRYRIKR